MCQEVEEMQKCTVYWPRDAGFLFAVLLQSEERRGSSDLHQMFISGCPGVAVTTLIKDLSALMFYSSFMRQPYLNYLSALILYVYKLVYARVHNCLAALSIDVLKHSFEPAFIIQSFVF